MTSASRLERHRTSLTFAIRLTVAALLALWIGHLLEVRLPLWVVLTAMIVTQTSLGRTLKVTFDYFCGTVLGAFWAGLVALALPQSSEAGQLAILGLAIAPLAFITAVEPRYATAPITAAIVLVMSQTASLSPLASVTERLIEVGLGGLVGLFVSVFLFPSSAYRHIREKAADTLVEMAKTASGLAEGFRSGLDGGKSRILQEAMGPLLTELGAIVGEANSEKSLRVGAEDAGPLFRSLLRLRHDLVIIGRAVELALPASLTSSFAGAGQAIREHFEQCSGALRLGQSAPSIDAVNSAVVNAAGVVEAARRDGKLRSLSSDELEHLFAMGFAMEQLRRNCVDLNRCINEWAS